MNMSSTTRAKGLHAGFRRVRETGKSRRGSSCNKRDSVVRASRDVRMKPLSEEGSTPTPSKSSSGRPSSTPIGVTDANVSVPVVVEEPGVSEGPEDFSRILVAGATGGVGKEIVSQLSSVGTNVVALARNANAARQKLPMANVDVVEGDLYQYATLPNALQNCDAVICAAGFNDMLDPLGPFKVDYTGTVNLVEACKQAGIKRFVLVTSLGTDDGLLSPLGPVLFWKKRAEEHLQRSGLTYTIIRPGGLVSDKQRDPSSRGMVPQILAQIFGEARARGEGNVVLGKPGTFGLPPKKSGSILRSKVAECCIEALKMEEAEDKVLEMIADTAAPMLTWPQLFVAARLN